jgi:hypothetical protein
MGEGKGENTPPTTPLSSAYHVRILWHDTGAVNLALVVDALHNAHFAATFFPVVPTFFHGPLSFLFFLCNCGYCWHPFYSLLNCK